VYFQAPGPVLENINPGMAEAVHLSSFGAEQNAWQARQISVAVPLGRTRKDEPPNTIGS
jgi:hypothetical protein